MVYAVAQGWGISQRRQAQSEGQGIWQGIRVRPVTIEIVALLLQQGALPNITIHVASSPTGASVHIPVMGGRAHGGVSLGVFARFKSAILNPLPFFSCSV